MDWMTGQDVFITGKLVLLMPLLMPIKPGFAEPMLPDKLITTLPVLILIITTEELITQVRPTALPAHKQCVVSQSATRQLFAEQIQIV